jgi:hypothetical protein
MTQAAARTFPLVLAALRLDFMFLGHFIYYLGWCVSASRRAGDFPATREDVTSRGIHAAKS